jgi:uncharacterized protein DUF72
MARLYVGLPVLQGDIKKYKERLDLVEIHPVDTSLPRASTLRGYRKAVPPGFVFSIVLPRVLGELGSGKSADDALGQSLEVAATLEARCVVLTTSTDVRPTAANRKKIAALFARIPPEGTIRCWEPRGMWERKDVLDTSRAAGVVPVFDAGREELPRGPVVYTRLRALGVASTPSAAAIERAAGALRGRREAFVVVEGTRGTAMRVKQGLGAAMARYEEAPESAALIRSAIPIMRPLVAEDEEQ